MMTDQEIMADFDDYKYIKSFCKKKKCNACEGADENGEPFGYGCCQSTDRVDTMYNSILARRRKKLFKAGEK